MRKRLFAGALLTAGLLAVPATALADDSVRITGGTTDSVRITDDSVRITADSVRITSAPSPDDKIW
ncbi:hypothetical protein Kfla_3454 [Kribbella flavida DSM 17836]|uniref:Uncharacterized protein n=1 Tax=Kribbella flavida (strain DSM 17836 / JCM 10339 / NBRC 14399) TaxID=479435 RepID=D2PLT2_KRIFD|nr:hypothetical protein [Kribbella flavida]ADB32512.1 hypothetical protein Kfla_3454 [Kribbella flavida DSM 17836]